MTQTASEKKIRRIAPLIEIGLATPKERNVIFRSRHEIYARELGQHPPNADGVLSDSLDAFNHYLVARWGGRLIGFISITPPERGGYSIDKYLSPDQIPFPRDKKLYEVRLLTVLPPYRGSKAASLLMYAAFRWVESRGGERMVVLGRDQLVEFYQKAGLVLLGRRICSGQVWFELMGAEIESLRNHLGLYEAELREVEKKILWRLDLPFRSETACFHGGAFFEAVGEDFKTLAKKDEIINADVLDAWFPPAPSVMTTLEENLSWLSRTSPPTNCGGMRRKIAEARGLESSSVLVGAGSSDLIFLAFREWLNASSRVLLLDPTYGEYSHVAEWVIGCRVDRFPLLPEEEYVLDLKRWESVVCEGDYDLVVLVNPNNPTGRYAAREALLPVLRRIPEKTRVWVDEAYLEYVDPKGSLETFASSSRNVFVCKSMSKVYALSGLRSAYLCGPSDLVGDLQRITPPWAVSLPAQVAAVKALEEEDYYRARYAETRRLREDLKKKLAGLKGIEVLSGTANYILCRVAAPSFTTERILRECRAHGLFLRDVRSMGTSLDDRTFRIAVKSSSTNQRMIEILSSVLESV